MKNLNIGTRLGMAFGIVLLITALIGALGMWRLGTLRDANDSLAKVEIERTSLAQKWAANINVNWVRTSAVLRASDPAYIAILEKDMDDTSKIIGDVQKRLEVLIQDDKGKALVADIGKARELYRVPRADLLKKKTAGEDVSAAVSNDLRPLAEGYLKALARMGEYMDEQLAQRHAQTATIASNSQWMLAAGSALAAALGILFSFLATRSIIRPIGQAR
jgi:methyl-accepting chemotaxis protein